MLSHTVYWPFTVTNCEKSPTGSTNVFFKKVFTSLVRSLLLQSPTIKLSVIIGIQLNIFSFWTTLEFSSLIVPQLPEAHSDPQWPTSHLHPTGLLWTSSQLPDQPSGLRGKSQKVSPPCYCTEWLKGTMHFIHYTSHESQETRESQREPPPLQEYARSMYNNNNNNVCVFVQ